MCKNNSDKLRELPEMWISVSTSLAYQECESDDFASVIIKFNSLKTIRRLLKSQDLYLKFYNKLKNLLYAQLKGVEGKIITYGDVFVINFNKELSFATSSNKAIRLSIKIINAFTNLNSNILEELSQSLNLTVTVIKKRAEELQKYTIYKSNVRPLSTNTKQKKYLKGLQIVLDQYIRDEISKDYKTDSLYSIDADGKSIMFYEIILDSYVLPPNQTETEEIKQINTTNIQEKVSIKEEKDIYSFKIFDINAKCTFENSNAIEIFNKLTNSDLKTKAKIISLKSDTEYQVASNEIIDFYTEKDYRVINIVCTEEMKYKPWSFFETIFREYFELPYLNKNININDINPNSQKVFKPIFELLYAKPIKALTPEDARFAYMEIWGDLLSILKNTVIIVHDFEHLDDTSIQTLDVYFDKFKNVIPNFVFVTKNSLSVHSKIKGLLRTPIYTEFSLQKTTIDSCLSTLKSDATDFIQSFYFEKISENFKGSYLYFTNAINYLKDCGVLIDFDNKLIIKNKKSVILPKTLPELYRTRIKYLSKNVEISFIFAYFTLFGARLDKQFFTDLKVKDIENNLKTLEKTGFVKLKKDFAYLNNYSIGANVLKTYIKKDAEAYLAKTAIAQCGKNFDDSTLALLMGKLEMFKEEYLTLWKNAQFAIKTGDYDDYLKNCLGFLSLIGYTKSNISKDDIEENKKEVFNNILIYLYNYSPTKIYFIEKLLLTDAINNGEDDKIVKLSNLMLQGALISKNYTEALSLLHNILSRMNQPTLLVDGAINTKFLLLSLVNIEILYNIGNFKQCIEVAEEILDILTPEIIEKIKPASFSTNLFVSHILETMRLVGFAKVFLLENDIEIFFEKIQKALGIELPEQDCILAIIDFLAGKVYSVNNIETSSAFSKIIYLILQEISNLKDDFNRFAQNIYQAKLLAEEINQKELEMFCDLMIGFAYSKIGITEKAKFIYDDILRESEELAMFNIAVITRYLLAKITTDNNETLQLINDGLAYIRRFNNQAKILYALIQKSYTDFAIKEELTTVDIEIETKKTDDLKDSLARILN